MVSSDPLRQILVCGMALDTQSTQPSLLDDGWQGGSPVLEKTEALARLPYWLALDRISGLGHKRLTEYLPRVSNDPKLLWESTSAQWEQWRVPKDVRASWPIAQDTMDPHQLVKQMDTLGIQVLTPEFEEYPAALREIHDPPRVLYIRGNLSALDNACLAAVGTRRVSDYGRQVAKTLIEGLKGHDITIISGLASGVDGICHKAALAVGLPTVAVFGCGVDVIYPKTHGNLAQEILKSGGALISEYPPGIQPDQFRFPRRNRIVAGLSEAVLVVEGSVKSGALITAKLALEENRTVLAVPGNIWSPGSAGPHYLLSQGAALVQSAPDILTHMGLATESETPSYPHEPAVHPSTESTYPAQWRRILEVLPLESVSLDWLHLQTGMAAHELGPLLTMMSLEGLVETLPGSRVIKNPVKS